ncbi:phosphotransferase family protein [Actinopolymorpha pittospori]
MTHALAPEVLASVDLPPDTPVELAGGATGEMWKVRTPDGPLALRCAPAGAGTTALVTAMVAAGRAGLPVGEILRRAQHGGSDILLSSWLPGTTVLDALRLEPGRAHRLGELMGEAQRALHEVPAPADLAGVPVWHGQVLDARASGGAVRPDHLGPPVGSALVHLDWHPLNILVDGDKVSGVVDWVNARAGHPLLDVARTHALMTINPMLAMLTARERAFLDELTQGWVVGYGPQAASIPPACHQWAGEMMLADLSARYAADPEGLEPLRRWTTRWTLD